MRSTSLANRSSHRMMATVAKVHPLIDGTFALSNGTTTTSSAPSPAAAGTPPVSTQATAPVLGAPPRVRPTVSGRLFSSCFLPPQPLCMSAACSYFFAAASFVCQQHVVVRCYRTALIQFMLSFNATTAMYRSARLYHTTAIKR